MSREPAPSVALVYPPFGPGGLPSLGLGLLASAVKRTAEKSRTYYWNLHFLTRLPGADAKARMQAYWWLTGRAWHPFSEWIFSRTVHDDGLDAREAGTMEELRSRVETLPDQRFSWRDLLRLRDSAEDLIEEAMDEVAPYSIVGIATTFYQNLPALALARRIKQRWPEKRVVLGGANCDGEMGPALFRRFPFLDHVFCGEVDHAFPEFVRRVGAGEPVLDIPGILSRGEGGAIVQGPPAEPLQNLDDLPLPDFSDFVEQRERYGVAACQGTTLALESSRGCWWGARQHCVFCGLNANGMGYRKKNDERFRWEVEETVRRYDAQYIFMTDNILPVEYQHGFLNWARDANLGVRFFYEIKSNVKRAQVASMADAGLTAVQPGIESFSSSLLALMRKGVSGPQNVAFLRYAREYGIRSSYNLLVGFPGADEGEYARMARVLPLFFHLRPPSAVVPIEFHRFSPYHQRPAEFGLKLRPAGAYSRLYPFPESDLAQIGYVFYADHGLPQDGSMEALVALVNRWQAEYREDDCTLTWEQAGDEITIDDRRPHFGPQRYRLQRYARDVFHHLDEPRSIAGLVRSARDAAKQSEAENLLAWLFQPEAEPDATVIRFEAEEFAQNPAACLRPFVCAGLLFEDSWISSADVVTLGGAPQTEQRYVALPVHAGFRPEDTGWNSVGV